jgi:hypothetical protein
MWGEGQAGDGVGGWLGELYLTWVSSLVDCGLRQSIGEAPFVLELMLAVVGVGAPVIVM